MTEECPNCKKLRAQLKSAEEALEKFRRQARNRQKRFREKHPY